MIHKIFSVFDQKAKAWLPPFYLHNADMAARVFSDCVNSDDHQFGKHPEDYTLFEIGEFDDETGQITPQVGQVIGHGVQYIVTKPDTSQLPFLDEGNGLHDGGMRTASNGTSVSRTDEDQRVEELNND